MEKKFSANLLKLEGSKSLSPDLCKYLEKTASFVASNLATSTSAADWVFTPGDPLTLHLWRWIYLDDSIFVSWCTSGLPLGKLTYN